MNFQMPNTLIPTGTGLSQAQIMEQLAEALRRFGASDVTTDGTEIKIGRSAFTAWSTLSSGVLRIQKTRDEFAINGEFRLSRSGLWWVVLVLCLTLSWTIVGGVIFLFMLIDLIFDTSGQQLHAHGLVQFITKEMQTL